MVASITQYTESGGEAMGFLCFPPLPPQTPKVLERWLFRVDLLESGYLTEEELNVLSVIDRIKRRVV